jgi:hypothetical protein
MNPKPLASLKNLTVPCIVLFVIKKKTVLMGIVYPSNKYSELGDFLRS